MRIFASLLLLVCVGCASVESWRELPVFRSAKPYPEEWRLKSREIGSSFVLHYHDCDDMAQEMADYLHEWLEWEDMRLAYGTNVLGNHVWLEIWLEGRWWHIDPAGGKWMFPFPEKGRASKNRHEWWTFDFYLEFPAHKVLWDGTGYQHKGDCFAFSRWYGNTGG